MQYNIFNGDADGIFALHQYRLENPQQGSELITGVKRDISLLCQVEDTTNSTICIFDVSLASNRPALDKVLKGNNVVHYFDHHFAGDIPHHPRLTTHINPSADTCTSVIVNDAVGGATSLWAICGAYGDNLHELAARMSQSLNLSGDQNNQLQELGELFNYNGYGSTIADLHFHPKDLYLAIQPYNDPFEFIASATQLVTLRQGFKKDLERARQQPEAEPGSSKNRIYFLPDAPWARRVSGVFSNLKAQEQKNSAHALLTKNSDQTLRISVRAPLNCKRDADTLCKLFPTGGGRAAAAGINFLPPEMLDSFLSQFHAMYP